MPTTSELWPHVTGTDVMIWSAMDKRDTSRRIACYKNRAGVEGRLNASQLYFLGETIESLPVIKKAKDVALALRSGQASDRDLSLIIWDYIDLIGSGTSVSAEISAESLEELKNDILASVANQVGSVFHYKGTVENLVDLPNDNNLVGDVYQVENDGNSEYCWIASENDSGHWEYLGRNIDLSAYFTKSEHEEYAADIEQRINSLESLRQHSYSNVFVREASSLNLVANTRYLVKASLTGSLPSSAKDGDEIVLVIFDGGELSTISAPGNITINGSSGALALNASTHTTTLVFDESSNDWVAF